MVAKKCSKRPFIDRFAAIMAAQDRTAQNQGRIEYHEYLCPQCECWHVRDNRKPPLIERRGK
jgi:hypothetical protein